MIGIYLSGTGNTKHCVEKLLRLLEPSAKAIPIEDESAVSEMMKTESILLAYPTQFSNAPIMVRDFIKEHAALWNGKRVFCLNTMGLFSGDGTGCTARLLKRYGAIVVGGLQVHMPDAVCDSKMLKKPLEENKEIVRKADLKLEHAAVQMREGKYPKEGLSIFAHIAGLFGQRLWFYGKTRTYSDKLKISDACIGCGLCAKNCPMKNLEMKGKRPQPKGNCTMCYRCISHCPKQAITLLGDEVKEQCQFEKYR